MCWHSPQCWGARLRVISGVEKVVGGIGNADFPAGLRSVATGRGRVAAFGVEALALRMDLEQELFGGGRLELLRDLLRRNGESRECWFVNSNAHGSIPPGGTQLKFGT
jgi:hypothetical protein